MTAATAAVKSAIEEARYSNNNNNETMYLELAGKISRAIQDQLYATYKI